MIATLLLLNFLNSVQQLSQKFPVIDPTQPFTCEGSVFDLTTINEAKVDTILSNLSNRKTKDIHCLGTDEMTDSLCSFKNALTTIINKLVNEGIFPSTLKTAIVTPFHKSADNQKVCN